MTLKIYEVRCSLKNSGDDFGVAGFTELVAAKSLCKRMNENAEFSFESYYVYEYSVCTSIEDYDNRPDCD